MSDEFSGRKRLNIILHGGHFKTGTTSFQRLLESHQRQLDDRGVVVPSSSAGNHGYLIQRALNSDDPSLLNELKSADRVGAKACVLSAEMISHFDEQEFRELARLLKPWPVRFVLVLRHWNTFLAARYSQNIRRSDSQPWPEYLSKLSELGDHHPDANFALILRRASRVFEDVDVFFYQNDITAKRVLSLAGVDQATIHKLLQQAPRFNASPSGLYIEKLRLVNAVICEEYGVAPGQKFMQVFDRARPITLLDRGIWLSKLPESEPDLDAELLSCVSAQLENKNAAMLEEDIDRWSGQLRDFLAQGVSVDEQQGFFSSSASTPVSYSMAKPGDLSKRAKQRVLEAFQRART